MRLSSKVLKWISAAVILVGIAAVVLISRHGPVLKDEPKYTMAKVSRGDIVHAINTTGQLTPWTSVEVSSQISGLVTEVNVDFESRVKKGQILAKIDPSSYEQKLRQAEADLEAAQASFKLTELKTRRLKDLRGQDLIPQQDYDDAEASLQQSQASLLTRKAAVENARVDLERCTIGAPIDGIVIFKQVEVGKTVAASLSAPTLFVIAQDLSKMKIIAPVSEVDVWSVRAGQKVTFTVDAIDNKTFTGRLTQIRNPYTPSDKQQQQGAQQSTITNFDAVIEVDNKNLLLRPSLTANVSIVVDRREGVLRIPNGALRVRVPNAATAPAPGAAAVAQAPVPQAAPPAAKDKDDGKDKNDEDDAGKPAAPTMATVYRLPGGQRDAAPQAVTVSLGISDSIVTEVVSGLDEGDTIVSGQVADPMEARMRIGRMF